MKKISLSLIALAAMSFAGIASAQLSNTYVGLQVGSSRANIDCEGATSCKKNDTAYKVYGGYQFTPEWSLELGYADLGKVKASDATGETSIHTTSLGVGAAYSLAFNKEWSGVARLGLASNKAKVDSDTERKTKPYLGLGVGYALTKQATLTGNWDWTEAELDGDKAKYNILSVGVKFAF